MSEVVIVAIIGVCGTLLAPVLVVIGNIILESRRSQNERRIHASSLKFNREFEMYQRLCEKHLTMVYDVGAAVMITRGASLPEGIESKHAFVKHAAVNIDSADIENKRSAPFISKEVFDAYKDLEKMALSAIFMFNLWCSFDEEGLVTIKYKDKIYTKEQAKEELESQQRDVSHSSDLILETIKKHLDQENNK